MKENLNLAKFILKLKKYLQDGCPDQYTQRLFMLFDLIYSDIPVNQINFSLFSSEDILDAFNEIYFCKTLESEEEDPETLFNQYLKVFTLMDEFIKAPPVYVEGDDFI